ESLGARSEIALTPALGDLLANFIDPKRTNPGLNLIEQKWRRDFWFRCTILVAREIQGPPRRSYEDATKIVARDEKISLSSLRKNVPKKTATPLPVVRSSDEIR